MIKRLIPIIICACLASVAAAQSYQYDLPRRGEGVNAFLLRNGYAIEQYKRIFLDLNKDKLTAAGELRLGVKYKLPLRSDTATEPLLGQKYAKVKIENHRLEGATYYLVSGHGGPDPGAMATRAGFAMCEDEYAYDVVLRCARHLLSMGARVHLIIQDKTDGIRDGERLNYDDDETCEGQPIPLDQNERLKQRCDAINRHFETEKGGYCRAVFVHIDSRSRSERIDVFAYHYAGSKAGKALANRIMSTIENKYKQHQPKRGFSGNVSDRNLFVLRGTNPVAVFLELGNIQNDLDQQRFLITDNREALGKWIAEGLAEDYIRSKK